MTLITPVGSIRRNVVTPEDVLAVTTPSPKAADWIAESSTTLLSRLGAILRTAKPAGTLGCASDAVAIDPVITNATDIDPTALCIAQLLLWGTERTRKA